MTVTTQKVLVIGGGFSGMAAAIALARQGRAVDLIEIDAGWRSYGAGISLHGATFRALADLDLLDDFHTIGAMSDDVEMRAGPTDAVVMTLPAKSLVAGAKGNGGVMRPALARMMAAKTRAMGVNVRLGVGFDSLTAEGNVTFTDGTSGQYDLVIGADGLHSKTRATLWPDAPAPRYIGQAVWRAVVPRPPELDSLAMWMGPRLKAGLNHVSETESYIFLTEDRPENTRVDPATFLPHLKDLLSRFPSPILARVAAGLGEESQIVYRPLEQLLVPQPWYQGRVVMIGDAVHATTPHMAAGALMGMEDALVLAQELEKADDLPSALSAFAARRWDRCRVIVENSGRIGEIEATGGDKAEHGRLMGMTLGLLAQPY